MLALAGEAAAQTVGGELRVWHAVTITFDGPAGLSESGTPNPFLDDRLDVTFANGARRMVVPGYYAADGDAAETGADRGAKWRVHFVPDAVGTWTWRADFSTGPRVAVLGRGTGTAFDGASGSLVVAPTDKSGRDMRAHGMLRYAGERYLRFAGSGAAFLEAGPNSPENLLAFVDFDGTTDMGGIVPGFLHAFAPHVADFARLGGGRTWRGGAGRGLLGAISWLAEQEMNSIYALTFSGHGDGDDVWPWRTRDDPWRYDCSKLDQWQRVFEHANQRGVQVQLVLTETENESYFEILENVPEFADSRKLYHRELVARFAHLLGLTWNLGEENGWDDPSRSRYRRANTEAQRRAFSAHLRSLDPYAHPIVVHTYHGPLAGQDQDGVFGPLVDPARPCLTVDGASLQGPFDVASSVGSPSRDPSRNNHAKARDWIERSAAAGHPWVVAQHEQMPASRGAVPDGDGYDPGHDRIRRDALWGTLMAGGAGVQFYFGYGLRSTAGDDLTCESFRPWQELWRQSALAIAALRDHLPFADMVSRDDLVSDPTGFCLARPGEVYAVYLRGAGAVRLDLGTSATGFTVRWLDPRNGGALRTGTVASVAGPGWHDLGAPPSRPGDDWLAIVRSDGRVVGSGCPGAAFPAVTSPPRLGGSFAVDLPPTPPRARPIVVVGLPPATPLNVQPPLACGPNPCALALQPLVAFADVTAWQLGVPNDPGLLGSRWRVQGAFVDTATPCLTLTGSVEATITR